MNAADIESRECNAQTLFSLCWWKGPEWLKNRAFWPNTQDSDFADALELATEERRPTVTTNLSLNDSDSNFFEWTKRVQTIVIALREKYWLLRSRKTVRSVMSKCVKLHSHQGFQRRVSSV
ncbi:hypothetical protein TNCV_2958541 [Trichonephila clavipes]|nr:hypothetical protein TNCV_2958541 [Trichonephila clavipes]